MNTNTDNIQDKYITMDDDLEKSLNEKYDPNWMEFSVVLRVKDVNKAIEYYCGKLGFVFERVKATSGISIRVYLRPFEDANTYFCLEQYFLLPSDIEQRPAVYVEIMPGDGVSDYEDFLDGLYYDKGVQFDYDYSTTRSYISVLKDPEGNPIWVEDGYVNLYE